MLDSQILKSDFILRQCDNLLGDKWLGITGAMDVMAHRFMWQWFSDLIAKIVHKCLNAWIIVFNEVFQFHGLTQLVCMAMLHHISGTVKHNSTY